MVFLLSVYVPGVPYCVVILPSYKDTSQISLESSLVPHITLITSLGPPLQMQSQSAELGARTSTYVFVGTHFSS